MDDPGLIFQIFVSFSERIEEHVFAFTAEKANVVNFDVLKRFA